MQKILELILAKHQLIPDERSLLVGISGIDAGGKGFITTKLAEQISQKNLTVANINVDGWLNLPHIRFSETNPAQNFYQNAIRFEEMFQQLILPLKKNRSVRLIAHLAEETATEFKKHEYLYKNTDIILLEGIFLFKQAFIDYFDLKIWIDCPFEIALQRALARSQENLLPAATVKAYQTIYFPAQTLHFTKDNPQKSADLVFENS